MYNSVMFFAIIVSGYMAIKAVVDSFFCCGLFSGKATACIVGGSFIGIFISTLLGRMSLEAGFFGFGLGIGIAFIMAYTDIIGTLISLIPMRVRHIVRTIFNVVRVALCVIVIVCIAYVVLAWFAT